MEFNRAVLIYNPAAGRGLHVGPETMGRAAKALNKIAREVVLTPTQLDRRADTLAREAVAEGFDLIVAAGGDGTVNEAIQGIAGTNATLLVLPAGTANVLARETGMPRNPLAAAERAPRFKAFDIPLGVVEFPTARRYFLLMCGAGFDAAAVHGLDQARKKSFGMGAYFMSALGQFAKPLTRLYAKVGDETLECTLALASKSRLYGGQLVLGLDASLLADEFDIACFSSGSLSGYVGYFAAVVTRSLRWFPGVRRRRASALEVSSADGSRVYIQTDGELIGEAPAKVRMGPEKVRILLPPEYGGR